ncbi:MAG: HAMP domain-containing sensor histidine kinase [Alsobacter sp.]
MILGSIRARLMALAVGGILATLGIAGVTLTFVFRNHMETRAAQELNLRLLEVVAALADDDGDGRLGVRPLGDPRYDQPYSGLYWQVWEEGAPILRSRSLWDREIPIDPEGPVASGQLRYGPNKSRLFAADREVTLENTDKPHRVIVSMAVDYREIERAWRAFTGEVSRVLLLIGAVLAVWAWLQTSLGISPLRRLQEEIELVRHGRARRISRAVPAEVDGVVTELNDLLDHQEQAGAKARERAGALAHGLKTPLTVLMGQVRKLEDAGQHDSAAVLREQLGSMKDHIDRELARARISGPAAPGLVQTDVESLVERITQLMRHMPRGEEIAWSVDMPPGLAIMADGSDLGEILGNLLDNARKWAKGRVRVTGRLIEGRIVTAVEDDGPGIPSAERDRVMLPGERAVSGAEAQRVEGSGLGLSIVSRILGEYETTLVLEQSPWGGCRASFALPGWVEAPRDTAAHWSPKPRVAGPKLAANR